jgi:dUTPase
MMFKAINGGQLPTRGSKYSAAVDLYAREDVTIGAGETKLIPIGVCIDEIDVMDTVLGTIPHGYEASFDERYIKFMKSHYLQLMLRSSLSKELIIANGVGVVDLDYKDEIMIRVHRPVKLHRFVYNTENRTTLADDYDTEVVIKKGDRVAQITLMEHKSYLFGIESEEERTGGFGSTGE